jgi:Zn-dependent protease
MVIFSSEVGQQAIMANFMDDPDKEYNVINSVLTLLVFFVQVNVGLAVFNLIPLPPLDGFNLVRAFLPLKADRWIFAHQRTISGAFIILILVGTTFPEVSAPLMYVIGRTEEFIWWSVSWIGQLVA